MGLLVRSTATHWAKGSLLAVDAGIHLAGIIRILEEHTPRAMFPETSQATGSALAGTSTVTNGIDSPADSFISATEAAKKKGVLSSGPFAGLELPYGSAKANGGYMLRDLISTYLITHPHLDHIAGFAVNTAAFQQTVHPKRLAALPSTIDAMKTHIFNDVIWPNLTDENGGVGLVTFMRLVDSGNISSRDGDRMDYVDVCDGISVNCWSVSHGQCKEKYHRKASGTGTKESVAPNSSARRESRAASSSVRPIQRHEIEYVLRAENMLPYDSAAFFLRDNDTGREALIFGDVEPDSLSVSPRTAQVWSAAAKKIAHGTLSGILIECSFEDSQPDEMLFGHLCPRHLVAELQALAEMVRSSIHADEVVSQRKRKRRSIDLKTYGDHEGGICQERKPHRTRRRFTESISPTTHIIEKPFSHEEYRGVVLASEECNHADSPEQLGPDYNEDSAVWPPGTLGVVRPLEGLKVFIIHVKDTLRDGPEVGDTILAQLQAYEKTIQLGCIFTISKAGTSIWL